MSLFESQLDAVANAVPYGVSGQVHAVTGLTIEAVHLPLPVGSLCRIESFNGRAALAEVIGFRDRCTLLMPMSSIAGVARGNRIHNIGSAPRIGCSSELLGRVIDGYGRPIDGRGPIRASHSRRIDGRGVRPLARINIDRPIATSIRAVDALHTCGLGQRVGIFSGPGVGKSTLISMIARHTSADVSVVALIGERGREVREFLSKALGKEGLRRCVVVVSTSDDPPLLRVRAARVAATVCEYFRDQGNHVMLLMDSLTRLAQAQRQIGLAALEPPATRGYPPSVFALLPEILERAGRCQVGSITGFYSVLVEADDFNEPIADCIKGIADGHLWLSRSLANRGHYPAIDVLQSISRVRADVVDREQLQAARRVLALLAVYQDIEDLVNIGAYVPGVNPEHDLAVQARPRLLSFLQQEPGAPVTLEQARRQLLELAGWIEQLDRAIRAQAAKGGRGTAAPARA
jgi:flagellum-specific ATP synthase